MICTYVFCYIRMNTPRSTCTYVPMYCSMEHFSLLTNTHGCYPVPGGSHPSTTVPVRVRYRIIAANHIRLKKLSHESTNQRSASGHRKQAKTRRRTRRKAPLSLPIVPTSAQDARILQVSSVEPQSPQCENMDMEHPDNGKSITRNEIFHG
jgi:hypothetical protein